MEWIMPTQMSQIKTIKSLPKISATWYLAIRQLHTWLELDDGSTAHPYILILINLDQENIISIEILPSSPKDDQILRFIYNAILNPGGQSTLQPCRPDIILCDELAVTTVLKTKLKSIEINIKHQHTLPQLVKIINEIEDLLGGHEPT
jgi:hypothetical protein